MEYNEKEYSTRELKDTKLPRQLHRHNQVSISFGSMSEFLPDSSSEVDMTFIRSSEETVSDIQRTCKVCGDRANGYNFGVLTCESCKAFSRRNAVREENIKCPFSNSCDITSASRRFCQGCRLRKCFEVRVVFFLFVVVVVLESN
ncbi:zinc finger, C4 type [Dictyocaulus viviparus]|uniref:Zinc finger, C4 type n=1 Tax=Dictyocaulus viviparus TaxID=29172 RepID=A0A0D8XCS8_DICVI|nr:zinc finger, C4 type [Dictyocaulus viviparus]